MEGTQANLEDRERENLIREMLATAQKTELPSELSKNPIIHKGDEEQPAPMVVNQISSAGYVWIWSTETGEQVPCLYYRLGQVLRQKLPTGKYRFSTIDPGIRPHRGTIKCMLHKDSPNREYYDTLGFPVCRKSNLTNPYQLKMHMQRRHPQAWATIEQERTEKEKDEDRKLQRAILASLDERGKSEEQPMPAPEPVDMEKPERELLDSEYYCITCRTVHRKSSKVGKRHLKYMRREDS